MDSIDLLRTGRRLAVAVVALLVLVTLGHVAQLIMVTAGLPPIIRVLIALTLVGVLVWLVVIPTLAYLRLEPALVPPDEAEGPKHDAFIASYLAACRRNPRLNGFDLDSEADLQQALDHLRIEAEKIANRTASQVFVGTAVSQYGSLDGLLVLVTQVRMT